MSEEFVKAFIEDVTRWKYQNSRVFPLSHGFQQSSIPMDYCSVPNTAIDAQHFKLILDAQPEPVGGFAGGRKDDHQGGDCVVSNRSGQSKRGSGRFAAVVNRDHGLSHAKPATEQEDWGICSCKDRLGCRSNAVGLDQGPTAASQADQVRIIGCSEKLFSDPTSGDAKGPGQLRLDGNGFQGMFGFCCLCPQVPFELRPFDLANCA